MEVTIFSMRCDLTTGCGNPKINIPLDQHQTTKPVTYNEELGGFRRGCVFYLLTERLEQGFSKSVIIESEELRRIPRDGFIFQERF